MKLDEKEMVEITYMLFRYNKKLANIIISKENKCLISDPIKMLDGLGYLSKGELILIKIAIDLWTESGITKIHELIYDLDDDNLNNVLTIMSLMANNIFSAVYFTQDL